MSDMTVENNYAKMNHQQLVATIGELEDNLIELKRIGKMLSRSPALELLNRGEESSNLSFWLQQTTINKNVERATIRAIGVIKQEIKRRKGLVGN